MKFKFLFYLVLFFLSFVGVKAQNKKEDRNNQVKSLVETKQYVFIAERALPAAGSNRELTPGYKLELRSDTLVSELPYFGRAYSAPIDPTQIGIQFTSTSFEYTTHPRKKGGWDILIKPKDAKDVNQFSLDISENGRASLQVVSNNRQPISFIGYIAEVKKQL